MSKIILFENRICKIMDTKNAYGLDYKLILWGTKPIWIFFSCANNGWFESLEEKWPTI